MPTIPQIRPPLDSAQTPPALIIVGTDRPERDDALWLSELLAGAA